MSYTNLEISQMDLNDFLEIKNDLTTQFDDFWNESTLENELNLANSLYLVAKINNEIVGFAGIKTVLDEADIMNIVTKKSRRNLGIATELLEKLIYIAKEKNIKQLTLEVSEQNSPAIHLYEKLGFKKIAVRKKYYQNTYDAFIMQMNLKN